ncbi:uncharacterized protein M6B38_324560 [Iris pallida]|uniref:S-adenosyl-L-methionine-dependent methyltransferase superfamily protein n=1 Tax=Iris pallida TaxID=29817 RepID=A0AAX6H7N1_IRIPA|nr:uncharacterized protein M6B38_324560 [Iris pallida]
MGSVTLHIGDGTARFRRSTLWPSLVHLVMLFSVLITNLFALYAFTYSPPPPHPNFTDRSHNLSSALTSQISSILREIELSERKLHQIERDLAGYPSLLDPTSPTLPAELRSFLSRRPLPLGKDSRSGITELVSSVAHSCSPDLLSPFMSYSPHSLCPSPSPSPFPLSSCDPLPRRRCLSRSKPQSSPSPTTAAASKTKSKNDFSIEDVLSLAPSGTIRVGFDFDAPSPDFAAAAARHNVTVVTSSPAPLHADGLLFLAMSPAQRLPFYDNIFGVVRVAKGVEEAEAMEFLMFDVDRVLRPKGLLWLDNYYCADDERKRTVTRLIERFGYKKLKWVVGEKAESGKTRVYLSAVLQKPTRG